MTIDEIKISAMIRAAQCAGPREAREALDRASAAKGLDLEDAACLLSMTDSDQLEELGRLAGEVKERIYGKRVVLFAPLYLSNHCVNGCLYCGFRSANRSVERLALDAAQAVQEAKALEAMGFKRVLLVTGEDPRWGLSYIISCVRAIYERTGLRIVHVNAPPMDTEPLRELKAAGVGVYQAFQETYHRPTYERMHPAGPKKDYAYRLDCMDRAMDAGFEDVGIGPLLGLCDHRFDVLCAIAHSKRLRERFGAHAHTISVPRLRPASSGLGEVPCPVSDAELEKVVAVLRLAVPPAGVVISTREPAQVRSRLIACGATQLSAGSRTNPGGYAGKEAGSLEQFSTSDQRPLSEVIGSVAEQGLLPSLCTTCYRVGRVGRDFTERASSGSMERFCQANAILTLREYLADHADSPGSEAVKRAIEDGVGEIKDPKMKEAVLAKLRQIESGGRDLFF